MRGGQSVPASAGCNDRPCGYPLSDLRTTTWPAEPAPAAGRWDRYPVDLHQIVEPAAVAERLIAFAQRFTTAAG
jgi:hypothetical protein